MPSAPSWVTATDWVGETVFGHAGDGSGIGTASLDWANPTQLRDYSSLGPSTLLYDTASRRRRPRRKASPVIVDSPQVASVEQADDFFGEEDPAEPGVYRFYGVSRGPQRGCGCSARTRLRRAHPALSCATRCWRRPAARATENVNPFGVTSAYGVLNPADPAVFPDEHVFGAESSMPWG